MMIELLRKLNRNLPFIRFRTPVVLKRNRTRQPETELINLSQRHISNLKVVPSRYDLLEYLPKDGMAAELGVERGDFSAAILATAKPARLYLIDSWASERYSTELMDFVIDRFRKEIQENRIIVKRGLSTDILPTFPDNFLDWVYIDTVHYYEITRRELELSRRKVKDDGIIAGHDYIQISLIKRRQYGVVQAVNEFCIKYDWEIVYLTLEADMHLSYALRKIK